LTGSLHLTSEDHWHVQRWPAAVSELVGRGLAARAPDPADRRRNVISITAAGTAHLRRLEELLAGVQDELLAALSPAEREQLIRLLDRILEHHA
jgi:MarR family transcriptional regulator, lower aerobic nicotinate degradation pathway regulator